MPCPLDIGLPRLVVLLHLVLAMSVQLLTFGKHSMPYMPVFHTLLWPIYSDGMCKYTD